MVRAVWNGAVLAESYETVIVEGNHYLPRDSIDAAFFQSNPMHTVCPWKGQASYFDVVVDGQVNKGAAWDYRDPSDAAAEIKERMAFWRGVQVED